jgi:hypothetical protein
LAAALDFPARAFAPLRAGIKVWRRIRAPAFGAGAAIGRAAIDEGFTVCVDVLGHHATALLKAGKSRLNYSRGN